MTLYFIILAPPQDQDVSPEVQMGNFTEYEDTEKEYISQIDKLEVTSNKPSITTSATFTKSETNVHPNQYIGFVIGVLSVVILILIAAIVFIVFRNHKLKTSTQTCNIENRLDSDIKVGMFIFISTFNNYLKLSRETLLYIILGMYLYVLHTSII